MLPARGKCAKLATEKGDFHSKATTGISFGSALLTYSFPLSLCAVLFCANDIVSVFRDNQYCVFLMGKWSQQLQMFSKSYYIWLGKDGFSYQEMRKCVAPSWIGKYPMMAKKCAFSQSIVLQPPPMIQPSFQKNSFLLASKLCLMMEWLSQKNNQFFNN